MSTRLFQRDLAGLLLICGMIACSTPRPPVEAADSRHPDGEKSQDATSNTIILGEMRTGGGFDKVVPLWETYIGITDHASTIHFYDAKVVVNSRGDSLEDPDDPSDGVYVLDPETGNVIRHVGPPGSEAENTNGLAVSDAGIYFGTEHDAIYMFDWAGNLVWESRVEGRIKAAPSLYDLDGNGILDIAVGTQEGHFYTLDGTSGKHVHSLKAKFGPQKQTGFVGTPALLDVTGDGVDDIFVPCRDHWFRAIDGKTGKVIWKRHGDSGMHSSPVIVDADADGLEDVIFTESHSHVYAADARSGKVKWKATLTHPSGGIEGLHGAVGWYPDAGCALVATAWWWEDEGVYCLSGTDGSVKWRYTEPLQNITSGFVVGDVDGNPGAEVVFGTQSGKVVSLDRWGKPVWSHEVGGPVECSPTLADITLDGHSEVLVASNDGMLRALHTPGTTPPVIGYYLGSARNDGVL